MSFRAVDDERIPRYVFVETGVGCHAHSDPDCLCDVVVGTPAPVAATDISFGRLAEQVMGTSVNAKNITEFASLVFGMCDAHAELPVQTEQEMIQSGFAPGNKHTGKLTPWAMLPDTVRCKMQEAYRTKTPWSVAKLFLPEMSKADMLSISKYYNQRLYAKTTAKAS